MSDITKKALERSLKKLLLTKPLSKITVSDITDDCKVNRMTFYYHFTDIYDLIKWICLQNADEALDNNKTYDTWQQGLLNIFNIIRKNKVFVESVYRDMDRRVIERYLHPQVHSLIMGVVEEKSDGMVVCDNDKNFIASFLEYAFEGMIYAWIESGMKEDPEYLVSSASVIIQGDVALALKEFSNRA